MMFHPRFIQLVIGALLGITGVRGADPVCSVFPSAQSADCAKLIDKYLADDTIATIDGTGHAVISSASCAIAAVPNGSVERISNDYLARHGLSIYDACGNGASMSGFQLDISLPTTCVLEADSVSICVASGIGTNSTQTPGSNSTQTAGSSSTQTAGSSSTQTAGSSSSYTGSIVSFLYIGVGVIISQYLS